MPLPAYLEIGEIPGSCKVSGRENNMEILGFRHEVYMPMDRKDGQRIGHAGAQGPDRHQELRQGVAEALPVPLQRQDHRLGHSEVVRDRRRRAPRRCTSSTSSRTAASRRFARTCPMSTTRTTRSTSTWKRCPSATRRSPGPSATATSSSPTPGSRAASPRGSRRPRLGG